VFRWLSASRPIALYPRLAAGKVGSAMKGVSERYQVLRGVVEETRLVDTHEHLPQEDERVGSEVDVLATLFPHYASSDLVSAGMSLEELLEVRDARLPLARRWEKFAPFWEKIQNTGYARALNMAVRDLYGLDAIGDETYAEVTRRMREANKKGLYRWVLKEKAGVDVSILDTETTDVDRDFFAPVMRFDGFITAKERSDLEALEKRCGMPIHSLDDLVKALELDFERLSGLIVGVKIPLAYRRTLYFDNVGYAEAEKVFRRIHGQRVFKRVEVEGSRITVSEGLSFEEAKPLQDFVVHKLIQLAARRSLPIQVHTGLQEGNENIIANSNPVHLTNLFMEYRQAKFDIFHGGYPYTGELAALAKNFPNVYIDMCWLHIISPSGARAALSEWLDSVPLSKIFAFGGDYRFVEGVYGHARLARENVATVLSQKVEEGAFTEKQAAYIAQRLLRDNARELFFPKTA